MSQEISRLTLELLNEKNYMSWARSVTFALSGRGKLGYVNGMKKKPVVEKPAEPTDAENKSIEEWQMTDHCVMSWILASIEPRLAKMFLYSNSAEELWKKIKDVYGQHNNYSYIYELKQDISQAKKNNKSHTEYLVELTAKYDELDEYLPFTTDPDELKKRQQHDKIYTYLAGPDSSYEAVRSQILLSPELPSFSAIVAMVQREDSRRAVMSSEVQEARSMGENQAFVAISERGRKGRDGERCSHCKKAGHTAEKCWILHPHLKPKWRGDEGGSRSQGETHKKPWKVTELKAEERKGFIARGELIEAVPAAATLEPSRDNSRLDRLEDRLNQIASLLNQKLSREGPALSPSSSFISINVNSKAQNKVNLNQRCRPTMLAQGRMELKQKCFELQD